MRKEAARLERVTMIEQGVTFLDNVSLHIFEGEILGLVSINAHGQEQLVRLFCQNLPIHYGFVYFGEQLVNHYGHSTMTGNRVAVIEKQSRLVEGLTVADNIFVLRRGFRAFCIRPRVLRAQLYRFASELGLTIDADMPAERLDFFARCAVELLKAVISGAKLIILRDISNFVSTVDLRRLHAILRHYAARGISFLYICNHHEEVFTICDRLALMEDGQVHKLLDRAEFRDDTVLRYAGCFYPELIAENMAVHAGSASAPRAGGCSVRLPGLRFTVGKGECVALLDRDRTVLPMLLRLLAGERVPVGTGILIDGLLCARHDPRVMLISENPIRSMLFYEMSYLDNLCFPLESGRTGVWRRGGVHKSVAQEYAPLAGDAVYAPTLYDLPPADLYGLIYCRAHLCRPRVVFCVQPFSGADFYLRRRIIELIRQLGARGIAVVMLAVSVSDCLAVAKRLLITQDGGLLRQYTSDQFGAFRQENVREVL